VAKIENVVMTQSVAQRRKVQVCGWGKVYEFGLVVWGRNHASLIVAKILWF